NENLMINITAKADELNRTLYEVKAKEELLNQKERILNDYISELNLSKERETSLGVHFVDLKTQNIYLGEKLNKTMIDRDRWVNSYETTKKDYDVCKVDYQLKKGESEERLNEIIRIRNLKPTLETSVARIRDREDEVNTNAGGVKNLLGDVENLANGVENETIRSSIKSKVDDAQSKINMIDDILDRMLQNIAELEYNIGRI
ncbi:MAG: hypothetical protein V1703_00185, partial [Candidatus Altiarchaeota archaeon]